MPRAVARNRIALGLVLAASLCAWAAALASDPPATGAPPGPPPAIEDELGLLPPGVPDGGLCAPVTVAVWAEALYAGLGYGLAAVRSPPAGEAPAAIDRLVAAGWLRAGFAGGPPSTQLPPAELRNSLGAARRRFAALVARGGLQRLRLHLCSFADKLRRLVTAAVGRRQGPPPTEAPPTTATALSLIAAEMRRVRIPAAAPCPGQAAKRYCEALAGAAAAPAGPVAGEVLAMCAGPARRNLQRNLALLAQYPLSGGLVYNLIDVEVISVQTSGLLAAVEIKRTIARINRGRASLDEAGDTLYMRLGPHGWLIYR